MLKRLISKLNLRWLSVLIILGCAGLAGLSAFSSGDQLAIVTGFPPAASWAYQLQDIDIEALERTDHDVLVIDYSADGGEDSEFTASDIARLKTKPDGQRRTVLAYLSIGEAEDYRFYWKKEWAATPPAWLGEIDPDWPGNYTVRYWSAGWQSLMLGKSDGYLHKILAANFDGVYLDRVDGFLAWQDQVEDAEGLMKGFVRRLAADARKEQPGFLIVQQNAENLLAERAYRDLIDAVAKEDLIYGLEGDAVRNHPESISEATFLLNDMRNQGKPVFVVEYGLNGRQQSCAKSEITELGYIALFAERALADIPGNVGSVDIAGCAQRSGVSDDGRQNVIEKAFSKFSSNRSGAGKAIP